MKITQKEIIARKLIQEKEVSNFWAFHNYILRLGALIHLLRKDGWEIDSEMRGTNHKECVYLFKSAPEEELKKYAEK